MKFIVSSSELLKQLSSLNGVITTNPVVPILENFLFQIIDNKLIITASDLHTSIITEFSIESKDNGSICVPAKILLDTVKNLPEQPIVFTIDNDTYSIEISTDNGRYKLSGENATDFPKIPEVSNSSSFEIKSNTLSKAINNTLFATSSDDLRPAMTGVHMNLTDQGTTFAATDGHRLVKYGRSDIASDNGDAIIIPRKAMNLLKLSLPTDDNIVTVNFNVSNAFFEFNNIKMICRLLDERFPDYNNVIPQENHNKMTINRSEFLGSLKRIAIYANKTTHQLKLKITGNELQISAEDLDFANEASERLVCDHEGDDIEIGFNAKFLIEILNNMASKEVSLLLSEPNKAGLIIPNEQDQYEDLLMLIMPVMLNNLQ